MNLQTGEKGKYTVAAFKKTMMICASLFIIINYFLMALLGQMHG